MEEFTNDWTGEVIRPGSLVLPPGFVSAFPPYGNSPDQPLWEDKDIKRAITDPNRRVISKVLPFTKYGTNQGRYSSCNGWAAANGLTAIRRLTGIDDGWVGSGSFVYSKINGGYDNGSQLEDGLREISTKGTCSIKTVPYDRIFPNQYSSAADEEAARNVGLDCYRVKTKQAWRTALAAGWVGIAAIQCDQNVINFRGKGIMPVADGPGNHAVLITDLRSSQGTEVYNQDNSWGINWGNEGRAWLTWDHFAQTFNNHAFYIIVGIRVRS